MLHDYLELDLSSNELASSNLYDDNHLSFKIIEPLQNNIIISFIIHHLN